MAEVERSEKDVGQESAYAWLTACAVRSLKDFPSDQIGGQHSEARRTSTC